jgi:excisionase family DNA binding protein
MSGDELPTVHEVAELLRLNPQTLRNYIDRGDLPKIRVGSRPVRIKRADLEKLIDAHTDAPAREPGEAVAQRLASPELIDALEEFGKAALKLARALRNA